MKILILYRPQSEHARKVEEFVHDFEKQEFGRKVDLVDQDSPGGIEKAGLYDILQFPAVLAVRDDGQIAQSWQGEPLPLMNEVAGYLVN